MITRNVIVIGASAGGLEALCSLTGSLPAAFPAAVMIVLHTSPQSPRLLAEIIGSHASIAVSYGGDHEAILSGHIYVAPPDRHLIVSRLGWLSLDAGPKVRHSRPAADRLFQSAAEIYGSSVVGVVLTGGDGDGTDGLRVIKAAGGLAIVQDPADAVAPSMPRSALAGDHPDYCLTLKEIGPMLVKLVMQNAEFGGC
jgi:two-component system, chemotaxis family, protein-glutamate methylesterase/glutaminase